MIEQALINFLEIIKVEPVVNEKKYKVKYTLPTADELIPNINVCVRILYVDDDRVCVEFSNTNETNK